MERKHAIIVIKNDKDQYLQIFQETWNSYLFLNCKIQNEKDTNSVVQYVSDMLGVVPLSVEYKMDKIHTKFSERDKIEKEYHHYFFMVHIPFKEFPKEFTVKGNKFQWYTYDEMLKDKRMQQVNSDIIHFVKEMQT